jgi:hypothetical protein
LFEDVCEYVLRCLERRVKVFKFLFKGTEQSSLGEFNCLMNPVGNVFSSLRTDALEDIEMRWNEVRFIDLRT